MSQGEAAFYISHWLLLLNTYCPMTFIDYAHRQATVEAVTDLVCLTLKRDTFVDILGPLEDIMAREKSAQVSMPRNSEANTC